MKRGLVFGIIFAVLFLTSISFVSAGFWDWWTQGGDDVLLSAPTDCGEGCVVKDIPLNTGKVFSINGTDYKIIRRSSSPSRQENKFDVRYEPYDSKVQKAVSTGYLKEGGSIFIENFSDKFAVKLVEYDTYKPDVEITIRATASQDPVVIQDDFEEIIKEIVISGRLIDQMTGRPVPGAMLISAYEFSPSKVLTDENGNFKFVVKNDFRIKEGPEAGKEDLGGSWSFSGACYDYSYISLHENYNGHILDLSVQKFGFDSISEEIFGKSEIEIGDVYIYPRANLETESDVSGTISVLYESKNGEGYVGGVGQIGNNGNHSISSALPLDYNVKVKFWKGEEYSSDYINSPEFAVPKDAECKTIKLSFFGGKFEWKIKGEPNPQEVTCTDSDRISETKEVSEDTSKNIAGLNVYLEDVDEYNLYLTAQFVINEKYYGTISSDYPTIKIKVDDVEYEITLISASNTSATIKVDNWGLNYYTAGGASVKGYTSGDNGTSGYGVDDACVPSSNAKSCPTFGDRGDCVNTRPLVLKEAYCYDNNELETTEYNCPAGCSDGKCNPISENMVCLDLIGKVKNPVGFVEDGIGFESNWNMVYEGDNWINGRQESYMEYSAGWYNNLGGEYKNINYDIQVYNNRDVDLEGYLVNRVQRDLCIAEKKYFDDEIQTYYICNWNVLYNEQNLEGSGNKQRQIIWYKDNVLVSVNVYSGRDLTDEEINRLRLERIGSFLSKIQNNEKKYIGWDNYDLEGVFNSILLDDLKICGSDVPLPKNDDGKECSPSWSCSLEPAICPPHGEQKRVCVDYGCDQKREETIQCSPGICSGCFIPRKGNSDSSVCIPYGTRIVFGEGDKGRTYLPEIDREMGEVIDFEILDESSAKIKVIKDLEEVEGDTAKIIVDGDQEFNLVEGEEFTIYEGREYNVVIESGDNRAEFDVKIENIANPENYEDKYIEIMFTERSPSYCNYDGHIYTQKSKSYQGNWAQCQNSYECESNLCSGGECVEINDAIAQSGKIKGLVYRVLCRLSNLFDNTNFKQCLYDNLGED